LNHIHFMIFKQGINLEFSVESLINFLGDVYYYLNYSAMLAFAQIGSDIQPIAVFSSDKEIQKTAEDWVRKKYESDRTNTQYKDTIGNMRIFMGKLNVNRLDYIICFCYDAGNLILRSAEIRFNYIMAMFTSFNQGVLDKTNDIAALPRIYDLIENSGKLSLIGCIGSPTKIKYVHGKLFNTEPDEEMLRHILSRSIWSKSSDEEFEPFTQYQSTLQMKDGIKIISITSIKYYDDSLSDNVYQYLIEDVTQLHKLTGEIDFLRPVPSTLFASMANFHTINSSTFQVIDPDRLTKELGFGTSIESLTQVLSASELADLKNQLNNPESCEKLISIIDSQSRPRRYEVVSSNAPVFFIFNIPCVSSISYPETEQLKKWEDGPDYYPYVYNSSQDIIYDLSNKATPLDKFAETYIFEPDRVKFIDHLKNPGTRGDITQVVIRVYTPDNFSWRIVKITPHDKHKEIFVVHFWALADSSLETSYDFDFADAANTAFSSAKVLHWIFENSKEPVRIFRSMPRGINTLIFNWATVENNIHNEFRDYIANVINECLTNVKPVDIIVPVYFEKYRWFLIRGCLNKENMHLSGTAFDLSNLSNSKKQFRGEEDIPNLERLTQAIINAKKYIKDEEDKMIISIAELSL
jgi:hypothetical protein